ncbi:MAG: HDOD domain-containing protein [Myxococcota bacterium]
MVRIPRATTDPDYGRGVIEIDTDDMPPDERSLADELKQVFSSPSYRPPLLPKSATEVLAMSRDPGASLDKIVKTLESDPLLVARVVSCVNSAAYNRSRSVRSLRDALSRLGIAGLRDVVVEAALTLRVFRVPGFQEPMERLRNHSVRVAEIVRRVCYYTAVDSEYAYLCGLLHDIGIAGILIAITEKDPKRKFEPLTLWPVIDRIHAEASATMAGLWSFPPELVVVLAHHHQIHIDKQPHPLCAALIVAEDLASRLGHGFDPQKKLDRGRPDRLEAAKALLSFSPRIEGLIEKEIIQAAV